MDIQQSTPEVATVGSAGKQAPPSARCAGGFRQRNTGYPWLPAEQLRTRDQPAAFVGRVVAVCPPASRFAQHPQCCPTAHRTADEPVGGSMLTAPKLPQPPLGVLPRSSFSRRITLTLYGVTSDGKSRLTLIATPSDRLDSSRCRGGHRSAVTGRCGGPPPVGGPFRPPGWSRRLGTIRWQAGPPLANHIRLWT